MNRFFISDETKRRFAIPLFLALVVAGLLGNHFKYPIFLNIDFLFGSIFAMLALQFFGLRRGALAGALIAAYTYFLWNHPYAIVIMTAEVAVVGWLVEKRKMGMMTADALYWLFAGMPLVFLFYYMVMDAAISSVGLTMTKQALNGIANALVARLIYSVAVYRTRSQRVHLREVVANLLIAFLLLQSLTMLAISSRQDFAATDRNIRDTLVQAKQQLEQRLEAWLNNRKTPITYLAEMATSRTPQQMQPLLEQAKKSDSNFLRIGLIDQNAISSAFFPESDELGRSNIGISYADRPFLAQFKQMRRPMLSEVEMSRIGAPKPRVALLVPVLAAGEYRGYVAGVLDLNQIRETLEINSKSDSMLYTLLDDHGQVIMTNRTNQTVMTPFVRGEGTITPLDDSVSQWIPRLPPNTPSSERWKKSLYVAEHGIGERNEWKLILEQPVAPFQKTLFANYASKLTLLLLILFGALALAEMLSRRSLATLEQLRRLTSELPEKLAHGDKGIAWPETSLEETHHLILNFREMAHSLTAQLNAAKQANAALEQRVEERTAALQESEFRWRFATEGSGDGLWDWNVLDRTVFYSKRWKAMLGYAENEIGNSIEEWEKRIHPGDKVSVMAAMQAHLDGIAPLYADEHRIGCKDGSYKWILDRGMVVSRSADGKPLRMIGTYTDITGRKLAEEALLESNERFRTLFDFSPDPVWIIEGNRFVECNPAAVDMLGYPDKDSLRNTHPSELSPELQPDGESSYSKAERMIRIAFEKGINRFEWVHRRLDQSAFFAEVTLSSITLQGRQALYCIWRDITERKKAMEVIQQSEAHFRQMFERNESVLLLIEPATGMIVDANPAAARFYGYPVERLKSMLISQINTLSPEEIAERRGQALQHKQNYFIFPHRLAGGEVRTVEVRSSPIEVGGHNLLFSIVQDITEQQQAQEKLQLAASVFGNSREAIMITKFDGTIIDVNAAFTRITGYGRDEVLGKNPRILSSGLQSREHYAAMWRDLREKGHWYGEIWNRRKNGEVYAEMQTISTVRGEDGSAHHYVSLFSDITSLKAHQKQLEHIAHYDALTGLPNRVLLADRLQQAISQALRRRKLLAVAYLDLDGFKAINDNHGHETGDQLLVALAARMKQTLREGDTLARIGGDEFVAVLVDLSNIEDSVPMITRMLAAAAEPVHIGELTLNISASLGVTFFPQEEDIDADQLQRQADQAMYQAKLAGKNRYHVFDAAQDRSVRGQHESLDRIQRALKEREFVLYYQPKVNMRSGAVIGAEALIRWQHPQKGLLAPATFLQVIEDHPLAIDVGEWVIDTALTQVDLWRAAGLELPVSVNVGARQLQQPDFAERLRILLTAHPDIRPGDLQIEVLETSALEDLTRVSEVIAACREIGVSFSLDDFGTGYSSLTYLKRLAVAELKIDQSFVHDMLTDPDDLAILEGVIGLATAFRRNVIAEGVETEEHGQVLLQLGCNFAQGYGIARPMPAANIHAWADGWHKPDSWIDQPVINRPDLPLVYAGVEHRSWIAALENHLRGELASPPELDHRLCRFGQWMDKTPLFHPNGNSCFNTIDPLHSRAHELAAELVVLYQSGRSDEALARLDELHRLRDDLLAALQELVRIRCDLLCKPPASPA